MNKGVSGFGPLVTALTHKAFLRALAATVRTVATPWRQFTALASATSTA